jgi:hypothetical protein
MHRTYSSTLIIVCVCVAGCAKVAEDTDPRGPGSETGHNAIGESERFEIERNVEGSEENSLEQTAPSITVQDDMVRSGQWLHIKVENTGTNTARFMNVDIDTMRNGAWGSFRNDVECPCDALCKKAFTSLNAGEKTIYTWDLRADDASFVDVGLFRVSVRASFGGQDDRRNQFWVHSKPFRMRKVN